MKLSKAVRRTLAQIAVGTAAMLVLLVLAMCLMGRPFPQVLYGALLGGGFAVVNFLVMGLTVQKAVTFDSKQAQNLVQLSYSLRMIAMLLVGWLGFASPIFDGFAVVIPFFFPRITILFMTLFRKDLVAEQSGDEDS